MARKSRKASDKTDTEISKQMSDLRSDEVIELARKRRTDAVQMIGSGIPTTDIMAAIVAKYGISTVTAYRDIRRARKVLAAYVKTHTAKEAVGQAIHRAEVHYNACMRKGDLRTGLAVLLHLAELTGATRIEKMHTIEEQRRVIEVQGSAGERLVLEAFNSARQIYGQSPLTQEEYNRYAAQHARKQVATGIDAESE